MKMTLPVFIKSNRIFILGTLFALGYLLLLFFSVFKNTDHIDLSYRVVAIENVMMFMMVLFFGICFFLVKTKISKLEFKKIIVWFAIFSIILLFIYPLDSADVFLYSLKGRMISLYNFNPYELVPSQISADLMYS